MVLSIGMCFAFASCAELVEPIQSGNSSSTEMESTSDGLENSSDNETQYVTVTFKQEGKMDVVKTLEKGGYTVVWNKNEFTNVTENITVMAIETAKTYMIILNANGGNVSQTTFTVTYGQAYEFEKPIHKENAFISWEYNGKKVALSGVWDIDIESGEGELLAEWGDSIWSKNY